MSGGEYSVIIEISMGPEISMVLEISVASAKESRRIQYITKFLTKFGSHNIRFLVFGFD